MHRIELHVQGIAFWAPRLPGWERARAILRGEAAAPAEPAARPSPALLAPTERRRAPDTVAVALEVAAGACASAAREPRTLPSVFASTYGDLAVSDALCGQLARAPLETSPTKFHHSIHNAAAGYWAIATGCAEPYSALTAHQHTFGIGLLTAAVQTLSSGTAVLYVAYDIEARGPLATMARSRGILGAGLVLDTHPSDRSRMCLELSVEEQTGCIPTRARAQNEALVAGNAMASCLALYEALAEERAREIVVALPGAKALRLALAPRP